MIIVISSGAVQLIEKIQHDKNVKKTMRKSEEIH